MALFSVGGRTAATAATIDHVGAALWNPHASKRIYVLEVSWAKTVGTADNIGLIRTSTRGTAGSTVTPDVDNAWERDLAGVSGALLDMAAFSVQPTLQGPHLKRWNIPAAVGGAFQWSFPYPGICIPFGTGLAVNTPLAVVLQPADVSFTWQE